MRLVRIEGFNASVQLKLLFQFGHFKKQTRACFIMTRMNLEYDKN